MNNKRFARSRNVVVFGVCAGLAEYIGMSIALMRVLWAIFFFANFWLAAVAYVVLAFAMQAPEGAPSDERFWHGLRNGRPLVVVAGLLIFAGVYIIAESLLHIDLGRYLFPVGLLVAGGLLLAFALRNNKN